MKLVEYNGLICIVISSCNIWSDGVTALRLERVDGRPMCYGPDYYRINNTAHAEDAPDWQIHVDRSAVHHIDPLAAAMYEHEKKISLKNKGRHRAIRWLTKATTSDGTVTTANTKAINEAMHPDSP